LSELHRVLKPGGRFALVENLHGNPIAIAYRLANAITHRPYRGTVRPRHHLRWGEPHEYLRVFPGTQFRAYQLFAPLLLASALVQRANADVPERAWLRRIIDKVERLDQLLLRRLPLTRAAAWMVLATGRKP
jgi:SAM-dependent methyltransferase